MLCGKAGDGAEGADPRVGCASQVQGPGPAMVAVCDRPLPREPTRTSVKRTFVVFRLGHVRQWPLPPRFVLQVHKVYDTELEDLSTLMEYVQLQDSARYQLMDTEAQSRMLILSQQATAAVELLGAMALDRRSYPVALSATEGTPGQFPPAEISTMQPSPPWPPQLLGAFSRQSSRMTHFQGPPHALLCPPLMDCRQGAPEPPLGLLLFWGFYSARLCRTAPRQRYSPAVSNHISSFNHQPPGRAPVLERSKAQNC